MIDRLPPAARRAVAIGLLVLVVGLIAAGFAAGLTSLREAGETRAALTDDLDRLARLAAAGVELAARREELLAEAGGNARSLAGDNAAIAGADLQRLVGSVIEENGGRLDSILILPVREETAYLRVGLRAALSANVTALRAIIHGLESGPPALFVDELKVRTETTEPEGGDPALSVSIDVYGFLREEGEGA